MNRVGKEQGKHSWLIGMLVISMVISLGLGVAAPGVALAEPETPAGGTPASSTSLYMPAAQKEACPALKSPGLGGLHLYGDAAFGSPYNADLLASGASWVRIDMEWAAVEPENTTPDKYQWSYVDNLVKLAGEHCLPILLSLRNNPSWASSQPEGWFDKAPVDELAQFMGALAERYDGDGNNDAPGSPEVMYFEMYNEPDAAAAGATERWGLHGDLYAAMLKAVYPAVKSANPAAQVVFGGMGYDWFTDNPTPGPFVRHFLDDVLSNGGGAYFDIMNFHFYPNFGWSWTKMYPYDGPGLVEKTTAIRTLMQKYHIENKPLIVSEVGWHNNKDVYPHGDNTLQVRMVQQLYTQAMVSGISMVAWWALQDAGGSYEFDTGLVTNNETGAVTRKPAYTAYQVFMRELANARYTIQAPGDVDVKVYQFIDDAKGRMIYVAWTNPRDLGKLLSTPSIPYEDTTRTVKYRVIGTSAVVYDYAWNVVARPADADDGKRDGYVTVTINGDPKYIVIGG
jgi:hypothetical protein